LHKKRRERKEKIHGTIETVVAVNPSFSLNILDRIYRFS